MAKSPRLFPWRAGGAWECRYRILIRSHKSYAYSILGTGPNGRGSELKEQKTKNRRFACVTLACSNDERPTSTDHAPRCTRHVLIITCSCKCTPPRARAPVAYALASPRTRGSRHCTARKCASPPKSPQVTSWSLVIDVPGEPYVKGRPHTTLPCTVPLLLRGL